MGFLRIISQRKGCRTDYVSTARVRTAAAQSHLVNTNSSSFTHASPSVSVDSCLARNYTLTTIAYIIAVTYFDQFVTRQRKYTTGEGRSISQHVYFPWRSWVLSPEEAQITNLAEWSTYHNLNGKQCILFAYSCIGCYDTRTEIHLHLRAPPVNHVFRCGRSSCRARRTGGFILASVSVRVGRVRNSAMEVFPKPRIVYSIHA